MARRTGFIHINEQGEPSQTCCVFLFEQEFQLNQRFSELVEKVKVDVRKQMSWPLERCTIALNKLQEGY